MAGKNLSFNRFASSNRVDYVVIGVFGKGFN
jgi:hypothetical protein